MDVSIEIIEAFRKLVGTDNVLTDIFAAPYYKDKRGVYTGNALAVVLPADTQQVSAVVALCAKHRIAITPQGGNTSLCGSAVPLAVIDQKKYQQQIVINLSRMKTVRSFDADNYTMTVEAGMTLAQIRDIAAQHNRLFPLSLTAIDQWCEIGGNLSTNAGGIGVLRYGNTRDLVLGLEVVLPDGRIWNGLRSLRKDNTGYDLKHLFVGAEGTLGIITAAVLKLFPRPQSQATACIAVRDPAAAVALLSHLRATCGDRISAFEIVARPCLDLVLRHFPDTQEPYAQTYPWLVLTELSDVVAAPLADLINNSLNLLNNSEIHEFLISADPAQTSRWWNLRKYISDAQKLEGISIKHDVSVPITNVPAFLEQTDAALQREFPGVRIVAFGHIGDGNIHYNASMPEPIQNGPFLGQSKKVNRIVYDIVTQLNGSISAEHGLGQLKRDEIKHYKNPLELELMRNIKNSFDPLGLMNPGKVI